MLGRGGRFSDCGDELMEKRLEYGNHLQWVYGDWTAELQQLGPLLGLEVELIA